MQRKPTLHNDSCTMAQGSAQMFSKGYLTPVKNHESYLQRWMHEVCHAWSGIP